MIAGNQRHQLSTMRGIAAFDVSGDAGAHDLHPLLGGGAVQQGQIAARHIGSPTVVARRHSAGNSERSSLALGPRSALRINGSGNLGSMPAPPIKAVTGIDARIELAVPVETQQLRWKQAMVAEPVFRGAGVRGHLRATAGGRAISECARSGEARAGGGEVRRLRQGLCNERVQCGIVKGAPPLALRPRTAGGVGQFDQRRTAG